MSGPKCGRTRYNVERQARVERERLKRIIGTCSQKCAAVVKDAKKAEEKLKESIKRLESLRADKEVAAYAKNEINAWNVRIGNIRNSVKEISRKMNLSERTYAEGNREPYSDVNIQKLNQSKDLYNEIIASVHTKINETIVLKTAFEDITHLAIRRRIQEEEIGRIREEERLKAYEIASSIKDQFIDLETLPCNKFAPKELLELKREINGLEALFNNGDYASIQTNENRLLASISTLGNMVKDRLIQWNKDREDSESLLNKFVTEYENLNAELICEWAEEPEILQEFEKQVLHLKNEFERESFREVQRIASSGLAKLNEIIAKAEEAMNRFEQRKDIGLEIMDALEEMGFDSPVNYYSEEGNKGSSWVLYATSPKGTGDVRMILDMNGKIDIDVENEPSNNSCVEMLNQIGKNLEENGIDFIIDDWGRAKREAEKGFVTHKTTVTTDTTIRVTGRESSTRKQ